MTTAEIIFVTALGAIVGSFLHVAVTRPIRKKSGIFFGRSKCDYCDTLLHATHNIPIVSFLALRGRCGTCRKSIAASHFVLELLTAAGFGIAAITFGPFEPIFVAELFFVTLFIAIGFHDFLTLEIPEFALWLGIFTATIFALATGNFIPGLIGAGIGFVFFGSQWIVSRGAWLGSGDIFLGVFLGMLLGWQSLLVALFVAYIAGSIIGIGLFAWNFKKYHHARIAFGPFLLFGGFIALFWGEIIVSGYLAFAGW